MPEFIFKANIAFLKERLKTETDEKTIATVKKILAEEEAKLLKWQRENTPRKAAE